MLSFELTPEQEQPKTTARRFAEDELVPVAARHDEEESFPHDVCRKAWELGLMNVGIPREYGGLGLGELDTCLLQERLNWGCSGSTNALTANGLAARPRSCSRRCEFRAARPRRKRALRPGTPTVRAGDRELPADPVHARGHGHRRRGHATSHVQSGLGAAASIVSSYAKAFGADQAMRIAIDAVQIFGGYG